MSEIKRYDGYDYNGMSALMEEHPEGDYVKYEDYVDVVKEAQAIIESFVSEWQPTFLRGEYDSD